MNDEVEALVSEIDELASKSEYLSEPYRLYKEAGFPLSAIEEIFTRFSICRTVEDTVNSFIDVYKEDLLGNEIVYKAIQDILIFSIESKSSEQSDLIRKCAKLHVITYRNRFSEKYDFPELPRCELLNSAFIDLASGTDFKNFYDNFRNESHYYAVDESFYVTEVLKQKAVRSNIINVTPINKDIRLLKKSDFDNRVVEIIRAKNIFTYVNDYTGFFHDQFEWICPRGKFIFATSSKVVGENEVLLDKVVISFFKEIIYDGWVFNYKFGDKNNPLDLNNVIFIKERSTNKDIELNKLQSFYAELGSMYEINKALLPTVKGSK